MKRKDKEVTSIEWMEDVIRSAQICRLAITGMVYPYLVPVNFGYQDGKIYFHSAREGLKIDLIRKNPNVCALFDISSKNFTKISPCNWTMDYKSVIAYGKAIIVESKIEKKQGMDIIVNHYSKESEHEYTMDLDNLLIIKVEVRKMTGKTSKKE